MSKVAWLFPGQGSQAVGMGVELAQAEPAAKAVLHEADEALGFALSELMAQGPEEQLKLTEHTQPAILTHSTMVVRAYGARLPRPDFVAGHSLGEYSALVAAGALSFGAALLAIYHIDTSCRFLRQADAANGCRGCHGLVQKCAQTIK